MPFPAPRQDLSPEKRRKIIEAARAAFGELGYERASVDLIASRAGVSKATVYNHFEDKQALFVAGVVDECEGLRAGLTRCLERPGGDAEQVLQVVGEKILALALSSSVAALYRQVIAEAGRLPEIGRLVFERGTRAIQDAVASHLVRLEESGAIRLDDDPRSAAIAFVALCQGDLAVQARLGVLEYPVDQAARASVRRAVRVFLRAYRT